MATLFATLGMSGVSTSGYQTTFTDPASRLEIQLGSVDYIVPKAYNFPLPRHAPFSSSAVAVPLDASQSTATRPNAKADAAAKEDEDMAQRLTSLALGPTQAPTFREPRPLKHLFVLDVSWNATASGFLEAWCAAVRGALFEASDDGLSVTSRLGPGEEVAFVGVEGAEIHFWDLGDSEGPRMKTVADLEEPFSPLPPGGLFVDVEKRACVPFAILLGHIHELTTMGPRLLLLQFAGPLAPRTTALPPRVLAGPVTCDRLGPLGRPLGHGRLIRRRPPRLCAHASCPRPRRAA
jgi:hypothetical protein